MTYQEAIEQLKKHNLCNNVGFSDENDIDAVRIAIDSIQNSDKYRWHELLKNPDDLPSGNWNEMLLCKVYNPIGFKVKYKILSYQRCEFYDFYDDRKTLGLLDKVIAWREIEPFEEEEE